MKNIFKTKRFRAWAIASGIVAVLLIVASILTSSVFYDIICTVIGGKRAVYAEGIDPVYTSDYDSKAETLQEANKLVETACEEGFVLLKNENNALPIPTPESDDSVASKPASKPRVSVFGKNSVNLAYGGTGSGGGSGDSAKTIYDSLEEAGYECNPTLKSFYEDNTASGKVRSTNSDLDSGDTIVMSTAETPQSKYTTAVKSSYSNYSDAAIVVFTRQGGEGADYPRSMAGATGARNDDDHFLQLDQNETDLLQAVCSAGFDHVIVLINSGTPMELAFLEDSDYYAYQANIDAALWIGFPGDSGIMALGRILNGSVNPSGRLSDTYSTNFKNDPTWNNFGDNGYEGGDQYSLNGSSQLYYFVDYEESIYVGYRYYETRGVTDGEDWYDDAVVYPFGYGLSYTTFEWTLKDATAIANKSIEQSEAEEGITYEVTITVKNTGSVAGKDVVQLYGHAPYTDGEIEKSEEVLLDFAKTPSLDPGEEADVTLTFDPYLLASYDYTDANNNRFCGYELDGGSDYALYISTNAHDKQITIPFSVTSGGICYSVDPTTGNTVENRYTDQDNEYFNSDLQLDTLLSRSDWDGTWPQKPDDGQYNTTSEFISALQDTTTNNPNDYSSEEMPWFDEPVTITLRDLMFDEYGNYDVADYDDPRWETLLDECSASDLIYMYDYGAFKTAAIENIGKPLTNDTDGPAGYVNFMDASGTYWGTCYYCCESLMAATWNEELMEDIGEMVGNEGIWGADGKGNGLPYSGWYAPGVNIHRSPFGGRNHEYFSEDGVLNGRLAAAEIKGCQSKGVYCYVKHFAVNEQETHRSIGGLATWLTEQSMREIYLRPFELAVKEGGTMAMMSSFNRIGTRWTGGDYRLLTEILREEWGFEGMVICDFNTIPQYMNSRQMAYAGGDINLVAYGPESWADESDTADMIVLRKCAKNVLYTVAHSNAMNGEIVGYSMPYWQIALIVVDCVAAAAIVVTGVLVFVIKPKNKAKAEKEQNN